MSFTLFLTTLMILYSSSYAMDTLNSSQSIIDGETLVSSGGTFELGFFSPGSSSNRYLGIWYRNPGNNTVVWVANRDTPITNTTGVTLTIVEPGILVLANSTNGVIWSSSNRSITVQNPISRLLDSGNLVVVTDANDENFVWQSFSDPSDTFLPGMRLGRNLVTGLDFYFISTRSVDDPAPGEYNCYLDTTGYPQIRLRRRRMTQYRIGPWNGVRFSGTPAGSQNPTYDLTLVMNENETSYREDNLDRSVFSRFTLNQRGILQRWTWVDRRGWMEILNMPADICDTYGLCGAYGICDIANSPSCMCLDRFMPRDPDGWDRSDWTDGCVRRRNLSCGSDVFLRYSGVKLPDTRYSWHNTSMTIDECRNECLRNCSCTAYTYLDISRGSGCLFWYVELLDIKRMYSTGQRIYIRMASSESVIEANNRRIIIGSLTSVIGAVIGGIGVFLYIRKKRKSKNGLKTKGGFYHGNSQEDIELPLFDLSAILTATGDFSISNKIGKGGFGIVYKGMLEGGQEIAVKRLSKDSMQGVHEFKSEVVIIAKLQHRNLVKLLGCCIEGDESMLIYEYMSNKSLDFILFDKERRKLLDWQTRFNIINGVARGLLYLHQDSRLRIIHRDLKASNVLLDSEMNPKISDFGLARSFGGNETEAKTRRVVGTYGYMAPEYAVDGLFSVKSDVFSFGVLVLEIVSGMRNRGFAHSDHSFNLLGHAWTLYKEERPLELVDAALGGSFTLVEILRSIHVGLLCVQQNPDNRPSTSSVVLMLSNEGVIPEARQPGFFTERDVVCGQSSTRISSNKMTFTELEGR